MNFIEQLSAIFEDKAQSRSRPAIIVTKRGREIKADHARWMKGKGGNIFLAVRIGPGMFENMSSDGRQRITHRARDFYAPPKWYEGLLADWVADWVEPECANCGEQPHQHSPHCTGYIPGHYDAHRNMIICRRFHDILTIHKENVLSIKWL